MSGFAESWPDYRRVDVATIPASEDKEPLVIGWGKWQRPPRPQTLERFAGRHPDANLAIVGGASRGGLICVDIDEPEYTREAWRRFGATPVVVLTPSGGRHLWYRGRCRSANLRRSEKIAVDIKGPGSMVLAPPSRRANGAYEFYIGEIEDFARLPAIRWAGLPQEGSSERVEEGYRNDTLFNALRRIAREFADDRFDDLLLEARRINAGFLPPMSNAEVIKTARSAWKWRQDHPKGAWKHHHTLAPNELLTGNVSDAAVRLELVLRAAWPPQSGYRSFPISDIAMQRAGTIGGWSRDRYRNARDELLAAGRLARVRPARGRTAALYRLRNLS
jgi:hypothetical protein